MSGKYVNCSEVEKDCVLGNREGNREYNRVNDPRPYVNCNQVVVDVVCVESVDTLHDL